MGSFYPCVLTDFQIIINGSIVSYATQSLFDEQKFYTYIQRQILLNTQLKLLNFRVFNPSLQPILGIESMLRIPITTRLLVEDQIYFEKTVAKFITNKSIGVYRCLNTYI